MVAPSWSLSIIHEDVRNLAEQRLKEMGLTVTYGDHVYECDLFRSASVQSRVEDIHKAFLDPDVKGILTVIGGWNSNQLLQYLDWDLIRTHPKVFCGFSDIDALNNAIFARTGMVTYSGPIFIFFGQKLHFDHTKEYFMKAVMAEGPFFLEPSTWWSDDDWAADQEKREVLEPRIYRNSARRGHWHINKFKLYTLSFQGTDYLPPLTDTVLLLRKQNFQIHPNSIEIFSLSSTKRI